MNEFIYPQLSGITIEWTGHGRFTIIYSFKAGEPVVHAVNVETSLNRKTVGFHNQWRKRCTMGMVRFIDKWCEDNKENDPGTLMRRFVYFVGEKGFAVYTDKSFNVALYASLSRATPRKIYYHLPGKLPSLIQRMGHEVLRKVSELERNGVNVSTSYLYRFDERVTDNIKDTDLPYRYRTPWINPADAIGRDAHGQMVHFKFGTSAVQYLAQSAEASSKKVIDAIKEANDAKRDEEIKDMHNISLGGSESTSSVKPDTTERRLADACAYIDAVFPLLSTTDARHRAWMIGALKFLGKNDE